MWRAWTVSCVCAGVRFVTPLEDLQQLEEVGNAEVEFRLHAVQMHTATPLPGLVQSTDPQITLISMQPRILLVENFLSGVECQASSQWCILCQHSSCWQACFCLSVKWLTGHGVCQHRWQTKVLVQKACQFLIAMWHERHKQILLGCRESLSLPDQICTEAELPEVRLQDVICIKLRIHVLQCSAMLWVTDDTSASQVQVT